MCIQKWSYVFVLISEDWLDNAAVYVGSCPPDDIKSNNECNLDIGDVDDADDKVEVKCSGVNYGRYVYIYKETSSQQKISLCEVRVYGDDGKSLDIISDKYWKINVDGGGSMEWHNLQNSFMWQWRDFLKASKS